jgi:hypothetical protein
MRNWPAAKSTARRASTASCDLLGLLIAFTFSGAATRFDERRNLIVQETNDIGTAYLRLDLLPVSAQPVLRDLFRRHVDSRLEVYRKLPDIEAARAELVRSNQLQGEIWSQAVAAGRMTEAPPAANMLVLPALNQMIDIEYPRLGLIRVDAFDEALVELRASMK